MVVVTGPGTVHHPVHVLGASRRAPVHDDASVRSALQADPGAGRRLVDFRARSHRHFPTVDRRRPNRWCFRRWRLHHRSRSCRQGCLRPSAHSANGSLWAHLHRSDSLRPAAPIQRSRSGRHRLRGTGLAHSWSLPLGAASAVRVPGERDDVVRSCTKLSDGLINSIPTSAVGPGGDRLHCARPEPRVCGLGRSH